MIDLSYALQVENIDVASLKDIVSEEQKYWHDKNGNWLGPIDIIKEYQLIPSLDEILEKHPEWEEHIRKIKNADYENYPIIFIGNVLVDGVHRLTKAWIDGVKEIKIKRFKKLPESVIISSEK